MALVVDHDELPGAVKEQDLERSVHVLALAHDDRWHHEIVGDREGGDLRLLHHRAQDVGRDHTHDVPVL